MLSKPKNVLVVDDEPQIRSLTCRALRRAGIACDEADDGYTALSMAVHVQYDAVLADLRMPNRNGHALCNDLLSLANPPRVMVMTGLKNDRLVKDLLHRGVKKVFYKPVQYDSLAMEVLSTIDAQPASAKPVDQSSSEVHRGIEKHLLEFSAMYADRLDPLFDNVGDLPLPPRSARDFISRLAKSEGVEQSNEKSKRHEGRRKKRVSCCILATVVPVDRAWNPCGEASKISIRDLSESGMRLLTTRAICAKYVAISWYASELASQQIRVVAKVTRCKPYLTFYDIGLNFVLGD